MEGGGCRRSREQGKRRIRRPEIVLGAKADCLKSRIQTFDFQSRPFPPLLPPLAPFFLLSFPHSTVCKIQIIATRYGMTGERNRTSQRR